LNDVKYESRKRFGIVRPVVSYRSLLALSFALIFCCGVSARAQMATGWIEGKVTDKATIAGIENVEVVIVDPAGGQTVRSTTNAFGEFVLAELISGEYELQFHKENFPSYRLRSLQVRGGCGSVVDVQMEERPTEPQATVLTWERRTSSLWSCDVNRFDRTRIEHLPGARNIWNFLQTQYPVWSKISSTLKRFEVSVSWFPQSAFSETSRASTIQARRYS